MDKLQLENILETRIPWLWYFQIKYMCDSLKRQGTFDRPLTNFERLLKDYAGSKKGLISKIYKILLAVDAKKCHSSFL